MTEAEVRAAAWLRAWDTQGIHRTGTDGDEAGAAWLETAAAALGAVVMTETFSLERVDPSEAFVALGDTRIPGVPVFDAPPTDLVGISGTLGPAGGDAEIGVVELSPHAVYSGAYRTLRRASQHRALLIVCHG